MLLNILLGFALASEFLSLQDFKEESSSTKSLIFVSSKCPCSRSHIEHIKDISLKNPKVKVFAVATETLKEGEVKTYYEDLGLPVIVDKKKVLLKRYKALKTPHVTLIKDDHVIYQGGVTNRKDPESATKFYFRDVLSAVSSKTPSPYKNGRSLGCYIPR